MDEGDAALRPDHEQAEAQPVLEVGRTFHVGRRLSVVGRPVAAAGLDERRVGHDVVKGARRQAPWSLHQVADHEIDTASQAVGLGVAHGETHQLAALLDARHPRLGDACRQAQRRRPDADADVEHGLSRLGGDGGGQEDGVDGGAVPLHRLQERDAAAEQRIGAEFQRRLINQRVRHGVFLNRAPIRRRCGRPRRPGAWRAPGRRRRP